MRSDYKSGEIKLTQHNGKTKKFKLNTNLSLEEFKERIIEIVNQKI